MLLSNVVVTKWNSKTKEHYEKLGYIYTRMKDSFRVRVEDLPENSMEKVIIRCDYCWITFENSWCKRNIKMKASVIKKDSCNGKCKNIKAREGVMKTHGVDNVMKVENFKNNNKESVFNKYGVSNVFSLDKIKEKIVKTNLRKYGKKSFTQTKAYTEKTQQTNMEKYGETSHMKTEFYREMFRGENSPVWKGGVHDDRWDRLQPIYKKWRLQVFIRDGFLCQKCLTKRRYIEAHHINNWKTDIENRYELDNGITFCKKCHSSFHSIYGKKNNSLEQVLEFTSG